MSSALATELELIRDLMHQRKFGQALIASNACEERWGPSADLAWIKATANYELGDLGEAEKLLRNYLTFDPVSVTGTKRLAKVLRINGRGDEAISLLESIVALRKSDELLAELAQNYLEAGNSDLAIMRAHQALEENADSFQALMVLGSAFILLGAPSQALKQLESARRLVPSNPQIYINIAAAYESLGNRDLRIASLERAVLCETSLLPVRRILAELYMEAGDFSAAKAQWDAMRALGDQSVETQFGLALAKRQCGDVQGAVDILLELAGQESDNLQIWSELAGSYVLLSDTARAKKVVAQILILDPENSEALSLLEKLDTGI